VSHASSSIQIVSVVTLLSLSISMPASWFFLLFLVIILCQIFSDVIVADSYKFQLWYHLSKTLAEEAAWKFAEECGIDLVAINPGFVIGPFIQPTPTFSVEGFLKLVNGTLL